MSNKVLVGIGFMGSIMGAGFGYMLSALNPPEPEIIVQEPEVVMQELTDEQLANLCAELTTEEKKNVLQVQQEVTSLQSQLDEKEAELERLKNKIHKDEASKEAARKKWKQMEEEIATLQVQLAAVEKERDDLKTELKSTLQELDNQVKKTQKFKAKAKKYKAESTQNLWTAFQAQAKVKGCDHGSRKRHDKCHTAFDLAMTEQIEQRFLNCVNTFQAVPVLQKLERGEQLPPHSVFLNQEDRFTENWTVVFCDPTLPSAKDLDLEE